MKQWIPYIVIAILAVCLALSLTHKKEIILEKHTIDTVTIVRIDTIIERFPQFVSEKVVDTIFVEKVPENGLKLPITQRFYSNDSYQAWVSGYKPSLDSINVFSKIFEKTVTNTVTKEIYPKSIDWYLNAGSMFIDRKAAPYLGLSVKFRNGIMIGANIGYFDKNTIYGINVGLKLNE